MEAGSAALRVDWPVYPRRAEHNTVAEGGNRRWAETAIRTAGADTFALRYGSLASSGKVSLASPVAIFATMIARASSSAGRFSPLCPVGTGPL